MIKVALNPLQSNADGECSLVELIFRPRQSLRLVVEGSSGSIKGRQFGYEFGRALNGFLVLDEGDLITFWESPPYVPNASILYEVTSGSVFETLAQRPGVLSVSMPQESLDGLHEYLIATRDECILVLSSRAPDIQELK